MFTLKLISCTYLTTIYVSTILLLFTPSRVFLTSISQWFPTEVWVTASLLKSPGLFSVFCPIFTMLLFGWSPLILLFPSHPVPVLILCDCTKRTNYNWITINFMFNSFFNFLARSRYVSFFLLSFNFTLWSAGTAKSTILFFLLIITRSGHLAKIRWSVCISKSQRSLCISFYRTDSGLSIYHLFVWTNLNFLHNSQWITLPT